jgi:hypothetical protein
LFKDLVFLWEGNMFFDLQGEIHIVVIRYGDREYCSSSGAHLMKEAIKLE